MNNWTHYFLTTKYLPKPLQVPWFEDNENNSGIRVIVDGIWEDGFRVGKAESRPPPNILLVPYHGAIIHPAEDRGTETPWLPHPCSYCAVAATSGVSLQDRHCVWVQESSAAQHLYITLHSRGAITRCTHPLNSEGSSTHGNLAKVVQNTITQVLIVCHLNRNQAFWFGSSTDTRDGQRGPGLGELPIAPCTQNEKEIAFTLLWHHMSQFSPLMSYFEVLLHYQPQHTVDRQCCGTKRSFNIHDLPGFILLMIFLHVNWVIF